MLTVNYNPGRLDRRVTLQRNTPTRDSAGGTVDAWSDLATVAADKNIAGANPSVARLYAAEGKHAEANTLFRIRYRADIVAFMRLIHGAATYEIAGDPIEVGRAQFLDLSCRAINQPTANAA